MLQAAGRMLLRWWVAYTAWRVERLAIAHLGAMSDRQLKDIGLVRSQIGFAVKGERGCTRLVDRRSQGRGLW
jgi:uncharacterized protein YjiS (DUF1127 family)